MPSTFKFPKNISKYAVDWSAIEVEQYPVQDDMKRYVEALASSAKFRISGGVLLEHDLTWDRGREATATPETMRQYYYLVSSDLALKDPPLPTKSERILFWSHGTDVGSLWCMLRNRDMLPMNAHGVSQFGCNIFYALGHEVCGGETDEYIARVLKDSNAKAFCVSRNRYSFNYIAFEQLAQPPSTARDVGPKYLGDKLVVADLTESTDVVHAATAADSTRVSTKPSAGSLAASATYEDGEHYDTNLVFKSTLRKTVEPSAWSRAKRLAGMDIRDVTVAHVSRRGMEEYGLRPLSHGRFTGIILTRNVAETVLLSQIQKRLREDNIDVDATIEAIYKSKNLKPPDKVKEATNFVTPLVDEIFLAMKPWTQVKNYGKNSEQDNQVVQRMQELEEEAAKYKQRLKSAGVEVTPTKVLPLQPPPSASSAPSDSQQAPSTSAPQCSRRSSPQATAHPAYNKKKQYEKLLEEPYNIIKQSGQQPPTSMTSIKTWVTNLKKTLPADKHKELDQHIQQVHALLEEGKYTKVQLQEMATRWGLPISLITAAAASPRTLQQLIAAVTFLAV
ncbi:unnamed protein product [Symbiodinium necroappetens]|uniref:Uncharacterized protein n=1 Tax=Symbiodinium necroappetens TaxID=1628268 RepID=A0A813ANQ9_9DINO|nr:unnamed protein product [Symbiodinium necroappetens]